MIGQKKSLLHKFEDSCINPLHAIAVVDFIFKSYKINCHATIMLQYVKIK
jgi:hypothetical protein